MILPRHQSFSGRRHERGSILVFCMVLTALGTIGLAAWLSLLSARGQQVEANFTALKRRAVQNNSKALAYHAIYKNHLHATTGLNADKTYTLPHSLGSVTVKSYATPPLVQTGATRTTKNGVTPIHSYTTDTVVEVGTGANPELWTFQLRSENPVLGGELLSFHPPTEPTFGNPILDGQIRVKGRAAFWDAVFKDFAGGIRADEFLLPNDIIQATTFSDTAGNATLPLNYPIPKQTTGFSGSTPAYLGELDIVQSATNTLNNQFSRIRATGNYQEVDGSVAFARGSGADTILPGGSDASLITQISTSAAGSPPSPTLSTTLISSSPLSSSVMIHALNNPTAFPATHLFDVLNANSPLPNDVLSRLVDATVNSPTPFEKDSLYASSNLWVKSDGAGTVDVRLDNAALQNLIVTNAGDLVLTGPETAAAANALASEPARAIALANPDSATLPDVDIHLINQNRRKLALSIATTPMLAAVTNDIEFKVAGATPFPVWNMVMDLQASPAVMEFSSVNTLRIIGGIRLDSPLSVLGGTLTIDRETSPGDYGALVSRNAWIEAYRN